MFAFIDSHALFNFATENIQFYIFFKTNLFSYNSMLLFQQQYLIVDTLRGTMLTFTILKMPFSLFSLLFQFTDVDQILKNVIMSVRSNSYVVDILSYNRRGGIPSHDTLFIVYNDWTTTIPFTRVRKHYDTSTTIIFLNKHSDFTKF